MLRIDLSSFQGGRFYRGRVVRHLGIWIDATPLYCNSHLSRDLYLDIVHHFEYAKRDKHGKRSLVPDEYWFDCFCDEYFQLSGTQFLHRNLLGKKVHQDRRGLYTIRHSDRHKRRPKRCRFDGWLSGVTDSFLSGEANLGAFKRELVKCNCCEIETTKDGFEWRSVPGLANSTYASKCKACGASTGDVLDKLADPESNKLRADKFIEGRPMLYQYWEDRLSLYRLYRDDFECYSERFFLYQQELMV